MVSLVVYWTSYLSSSTNTDIAIWSHFAFLGAVFFIMMLSAVMLSAAMLSAVMLSAVMLSVVAPSM
jgi:hypothetical protein